MFANFLIGLREGLEAALVVGILVAYLVRTGNRDRLRPLWIGVAIAIGLSLAFGAGLTFTSHALTHTAQEGFDAIASTVAVVFVTGMIFWMRTQSRALKGELQDKLALALRGGGYALAATAFLAVAREGLETALFLWSNVQATGDSGAGPAVGATIGLLTATVLGVLVYRRSVQLNLAQFFKVTGGALIFVVAGVAAYAAHDYIETGWVTFLSGQAFDVSRHIPPSSWYGTLLKGTIGFNPTPFWLEVVVYLGFLVPTLFLFFRPVREPAPARAAASREGASAAAASH